MAIIAQGSIPDEKNSTIFRFVERILKEYNAGRCVLLGISGAGGAGKTTFANNLCEFIGQENSLSIDLDDYLISREERGKLEVTGYNPVANRLHLARQNLEDLRAGKTVMKPAYDHRTGQALPLKPVEPKGVIVVEGVTTLYPELREMHNISFFLDAPDETQIKSRITRDVNERGYTLEQALQLFHAVQPDYRRFVEPTKQFADVVCHVSPEYVMTITHCADRLR